MRIHAFSGPQNPYVALKLRLPFFLNLEQSTSHRHSCFKGEKAKAECSRQTSSSATAASDCPAGVHILSLSLRQKDQTAVRGGSLLLTGCSDASNAPSKDALWGEGVACWGRGPGGPQQALCHHASSPRSACLP